MPEPQIVAALKRRATAAPIASPWEPVCSIFRRYLRAKSLKFTPERAMLLDAVLRREGLFEAEALIDDLKALGHRVSRATIYRTLNHLEEAGVLRQIHFDGRQAYYELAAGQPQSDYLVCTVTGKVVKFSSDELRLLRDKICAEHGFEPVSHQFHVFGIAQTKGSAVVCGVQPSSSAGASSTTR